MHEYLDCSLQVANYIIDPMCRGIFAGDITKLSMKSCLPPVYNLEESSGSVVKGLLFGKGKLVAEVLSPYRDENRPAAR